MSRRPMRVIGADGALTEDLVVCRHAGDVVMVPARSRRLHGRLAETARLGRRRADSVPRERRRQPRTDGLEHAAPGGAARQGRCAARRHRHGMASSRAIRARRSPHAAPGVIDQIDATRIVIRATEELDAGEARRRHLPADEVPAFESVDLHQPEAARPCRRFRAQGRHHRRRALDRSRRSGARPQCARRLHALERL